MAVSWSQLFAIFYHDVEQAIKDFNDKDAVDICYRHDGSMFHLWQLQAHDADDAALATHTESLTAINVLLCRGCLALWA